ncbi:MAG: fumarate reductase subunit D [Betaproteobacteria bacterium]|nr:fumarate reductase subunit D [Betaproteobacteria bacterium]
MAKSNKPVVWGLFAAGGTVTAFIMPALVLLVLLAAFGRVPDILTYEKLHAFAAQWWGKAVLLGIIFLALWHAAHRLRITLHDVGVRADATVAVAVYAVAAVASVAAAFYLLRI